MRKITVLIAMLFSIANAFSQMQVKGKVTDNSGLPVANASISVKGSAGGTISKEDGSFAILVSPGFKTLTISSTGFISQDVLLNSSFLNVSLKKSSSNLSEVVVVAYGTKERVNLTGSVATVKSNYVENKPFTSVDKELQGAITGLLSTSASGAPGSNTDIRIRGTGSITANASPLWVIDGVISSTGDFSVNTTTTNSLSSLNPDDIESITVLKDASATALYGSRAANGVIIVTTKKGKAGKTNIEFNTEDGYNDIAFKNNNNRPMTTAENKEVLEEAFINAGIATDDSSADAAFPQYGINLYPNVNTNWIDAVTQKGSQQLYNLSMSGGNERTQVYASGGYFGQTGTTIATDYNRYNGALSITHKASDKLTITSGINGSSALQHTPANGGAFTNPVLASFFLVPWYSPYNSDGSLRYNDSLNEFPYNGAPYNPVAIAKLNNNSAQIVTLRGYLSGEYKILDNFKFTSRYSAEYFTLQENQYVNPFYGSEFISYNNVLNEPSGYTAASYTRVFDYTWDNFFDYRKNLNQADNFYFDLKAGYEAQAFNYYTLQTGATIVPEILSLQTVATTTAPKVAYALPSGNSSDAIFSTGDINYKDRYIINGSFRRDGSSVFGADNRYGNFYSIGGTWNANEEDFLKNNSLISLLKVRTSYGTTGNSTGFGNYTSLSTYSYPYSYAGQPGSQPTNVGNPNLTWETNKIFDAGLDIGILKNRISATIDYYDRKTTNLLLDVPFSLTSGFTGQNENAGALDNKGVEIALIATPVRLKNFSWDIAFNISHNKNTVTALYQNQPILPPSPSTTSNALPLYYDYTVGYNLQTFYLPQWAGVDPSNGNPLWYTDATRSKTTDDYTQAQYVLNPKYSSAPKYFGSFTNDFNYKNFSLSVQFYYNFGNYFYDDWASYTLTDGEQLGYFNQSSLELKAWQKPGDITNVPRVVFGGVNPNSFYPSTRFLYSGNYIRLRNIEFAYSIPQSIIKKIKINNLKVYARGTNLFTFATDKNIPYDPESGINTTGNFEVFIPKTITFGLKVDF